MDLKQRWDDYLHHIGGTPAGTFTNVLQPRYSEPHRKYHNLSHIEACLNMFDEHVPKSVNFRNHIELAIRFHDVVYDSTSKTNEEDSAKLLLEEAKKSRIRPQLTLLAETLIMATKSHEFPSRMSEEMAWFLDIDLSILGADEAVFVQYEKDVREEFAWVPDQAFKQGRSDILRSFLDRDWVFATKEFRRLYEGTARNNIKRSLAQLGTR